MFSKNKVLVTYSLSTVSDETKKKQKITIRLIADFCNTLGKYLLTAQKTRKVR